MSGRVYENLGRARDQFGGGPLFAPEEMGEFTVDGVQFVLDYAVGSTPERFYLVKQARFAEQYRELAAGIQGARIVELGIAEGGSTALLALVAQPAKLVAVEIEQEPLEPLLQFIEQRGLTDVVRPFFGVDQGDRPRLAAIVDAELGGEPIDVVFDDASHQLDLTRSSFETLFPRMRPGGRYYIEDWNHDHAFRVGVAKAIRSGSADEQERFRSALAEQLASSAPGAAVSRPLSDLALELVLARAGGTVDAVADVTFGEFWVSVTRGTAPLDPETFRVADLYEDYFDHLP